MRQLILYGTSACHLCEQAEELITPLLSTTLQMRFVDIADQPELMNQYGLFIPVLKIEGASQALYWPFDADRLSAYLES